MRTVVRLQSIVQVELTPAGVKLWKQAHPEGLKLWKRAHKGQDPSGFLAMHSRLGFLKGTQLTIPLENLIRIFGANLARKPFVNGDITLVPDELLPPELRNSADRNFIS